MERVFKAEMRESQFQAENKKGDLDFFRILAKGQNRSDCNFQCPMSILWVSHE
jgi:hypothetical protein